MKVYVLDVNSDECGVMDCNILSVGGNVFDVDNNGNHHVYISFEITSLEDMSGLLVEGNTIRFVRGDRSLDMVMSSVETFYCERGIFVEDITVSGKCNLSELESIIYNK